MAKYNVQPCLPSYLSTLVLRSSLLNARFESERTGMPYAGRCYNDSVLITRNGPTVGQGWE